MILEDSDNTALDTPAGATESPQTIEDAALEAVGMPTDGDAEPKEGGLTEATDKPAAAEKPKEAAKTDKPFDPKSITDADLQRPENLNRKSGDRFEKLVSGYKAEKTRADQTTAQLGQMQESFKALQDLGFKDEASASALIEFSKYRQSLSGDGEAAIKILQNQIRMIEMRTGKNVQASALEQHNDLADEVRSERLDYGRALEIAKARDQLAAQEQQNQQYQQRQQQEFQSTQAIQGSIQSVEGLEANWRATDPDYPAIHPHILAEMPNIRQHFPPAMWPRQIELLYNTTKRAMTSQARPSINQPAPLRGNGNTVSRAAPKSFGEAALAALNMSGE